MKTKEYCIVTKSNEFKEYVVKRLSKDYGIKADPSYTVSSWYIRFICDKETYKNIKRDFNLHTQTVYVRREND